MKKSLFLAGIGCCFALGCGPESTPTNQQPEMAQEPIIGGTTDNGDLSVVAVFVHQPGAASGSLCSGAVVSKRAVLTAAHCVDPRVIGSGNVIEVLVGTYLSNATSLRVSDTAFDSAFDPNNLAAGHDIAVVTLAQDTTLTPLAYNRGDLGNGSIRLVGYGTSTHGGNGAGTKRSVTTSMDAYNSILVQIGTSGQQTCHGDSGGPAFQTIDGVERIIGVTSYGSDYSTRYQCYGGGVDTRVDAYLDFVDSHI